MTEALYTVEFGDVTGSGYINGGVVVLETNRVFGGDSGYYYLGNYTVKDGVLTATVEITKHNPAWANAFGDYAGAFRIQVTGQIQGQNVVGMMQRIGTQITLPVRLLWKAKLP